MIEIRRVADKPVVVALQVPTEQGTKYKTVIFSEEKQSFKVDAMTAHAMITHPFGAFEPVATRVSKKTGRLLAAHARPLRSSEMVVQTEAERLELIREVENEKDADKQAELIGRLNASVRYLRTEGDELPSEGSAAEDDEADDDEDEKEPAKKPPVVPARGRHTTGRRK